MRYISTRGGIEPLGFQDAVMMGLARDGGLLLPETLPTIDAAVLDSWQHLPYQSSGPRDSLAVHRRYPGD